MNAATAAEWSLLTPRGAGAIAIVQIAGDVDDALRAAGIAPLAAGRVAVRDLAGADRGVVTRPTHDVAQLMPHAGERVVRMLCEALTRAGIPERTEEGDAARRVYPEAATTLEARMLDAIARAASPIALKLLADQPRRWADAGVPDPADDHPAPDPHHSATLNRLIDPPLVAALGPANVGKSTLLNALAGRSVALVADEPGTTRDHVGVALELAGLVVRYVDCPGLRDHPDSIEADAQELAAAVVRAADLVLLCGDAASPPHVLAGRSDAAVLRVALRTDLGPAEWGADARVCAPRGEGVADLAGLIRERLVPRRLLDDPRPWRFWR